MKNLNLKAMLLGSLVVLLSSMLGVVAVVFAVAVQLPAHGLPSSELPMQLQAPLVRAAILTMVLAASVLGGFVTARIAKTRELGHAAAAGVMWLAYTFLALRYAKVRSTPLSTPILAYISVLFGGHLGRLRNRTAAGRSNRPLQPTGSADG